MSSSQKNFGTKTLQRVLMTMREPNCRTCGVITKRHDGLCPNHFYIEQPWRRLATYGMFDQYIQELGGACRDCGETAHSALMCIFDNGTERGGTPSRYRGAEFDAFRYEMATNPDKRFVRCCNCQAQHQRVAGRPPKFTIREVKRRANLQKRLHMERVREKVLDMYPKHCECGLEATRVLYVGPAGKGPKSGEWNKYQCYLLKDAELRERFKAYCADCTPQTLQERLEAARMAKVMA